MPRASPRKSSTSSGRPSSVRPRYLGIEVAGEHLPSLSPRWWEGVLRTALDRAGVAGRFRLIRADGARAVAEVDQHRARSVRDAWTTTVDDASGAVRIATRRTWGTLRGAKAWVRGAGP
jgi:hypothetical protein